MTAVGRRPTAVITGAASGMGRATAAALVKDGWDVIALDRVATEFEVSGEHVRTRRGRRHPPRPGPGRDHRASERGFLAAAGRQHRRNLPAQHAERLHRGPVPEGVRRQRARRLNVAAEAAAHMPAGGSIINFASVDAFAVSRGQLLYGASKAAVVMLTKELALELAPQRIRVNAIAPGWVNTPGNAATGRMTAAAAGIPLGRVAEPDEIARWVAILASPDASFMTGETIVLSGGDVIR